MSLGTQGNNASCPFVQRTDAYSGNTTHAACYGPYQTGELGANITAILGRCCSGTLNDTVPVPVTFEQSAAGPPATNCWYRCEAPWIENRTQPDNGRGFFQLERCIQSESMDMARGFDNSTNPFQLSCYPKTSETKATADGARASRISMWALGFVGLLVVPLFSA
jgi:hypothetical protein